MSIASMKPAFIIEAGPRDQLLDAIGHVAGAEFVLQPTMLFTVDPAHACATPFT